MRQTISSILISVTCLLNAQIPNTSINELSVMTWNVWYGFSQLDESAGNIPASHSYSATQSEVQQKATDFLRSLSPDVLALQELKNFDATKLSTFAQSYGHNYSYIFDRDTQQPTGITSKYPIEFLEGINGDYNGTNLEGTFAAKLSNEPIVFIIVHLKSSNKNHREKETKYVLELYEKYMNLNNHVIILGDFNSMTITDRTYAEANIDKRLQYRIFKNKCNHELNRANEPDNGMVACSSWDYRMMDQYWNHSGHTIIDITDQYATRDTYETNKLWGTFPSSSVALFHDDTNLDHNGNPTTTHLQSEHLARIDFVLTNEDLADCTVDSRIIHQYVGPNNSTVLIDEMSDHYPVFAIFKNIPANIDEAKASIQVYPNPVNNTLYCATKGQEHANYQIYNLTGRLVKHGNLANGNNINISSLAKGIYFLQLSELATTKFIKN
ncbi:T9SS type A sorting domain-containing protein [Carboxylicivirga marina]|uniref:T9SS type A sorting domain-containing protein n=1 Tax=Carboxylicivirga marina TaxID=2800988 RepID=UPI0025913465|nr:T9SS type A sorting domain-containing protein [uncultured Carboxylicivirga sp.]